MRLAEGLELFRGTQILEAAPCVHVGQYHDLLGAEDLGGIGHELDPAEDDHVGVSLGRLARQVEAVPHEIGDVLDIGALVIMRQDHRVAFFTQRSEEHTSELQSLMRISYAVFCLKKKNKAITHK